MNTKSFPKLDLPNRPVRMRDKDFKNLSAKEMLFEYKRMHQQMLINSIACENNLFDWMDAVLSSVINKKTRSLSEK